MMDGVAAGENRRQVVERRELLSTVWKRKEVD
jgi:DNA-binding winged helix-turn-helix (wHTH) protein